LRNSLPPLNHSKLLANAPKVPPVTFRCPRFTVALYILTKPRVRVREKTVSGHLSVSSSQIATMVTRAI